MGKVLDWEPRDTEEEQWKPVPNFDSYFVSTLGRIISTKQGSPRELRHYSACGKRIAQLYGSRGDKLRVTVASLVLEVFVGESPLHRREIIYLDGNSDNVSLSNLRWVTPDSIYQYRSNMGINAYKGKRGIIRVESGRLYDSVRDAALETGIGYQTIYNDLAKSARGKATRRNWKFIDREGVLQEIKGKAIRDVAGSKEYKTANLAAIATGDTLWEIYKSAMNEEPAKSGIQWEFCGDGWG